MNMELKHGKALWSRIQSDAMRTSYQRGAGHNLPGAVIESAQNIFRAEPENRFEFDDFEAWFSAVRGFGFMPKDGSAHRGRVANSESIQKRYIDMSWDRDWLPPDEVLNARWNCKDGTLSSIRSLAKKYGFAYISDGFEGWQVIARPAVKPAEVKRPRKPSEINRKRQNLVAKQEAVPVSDIQPALIQSAAVPENADLAELLRELISVTRRAWGILD
jgi:hypothetical protein